MATRRLSFHHDHDTPILREITLAIHHGERVAVLGPNGAGKSTLALHMNGIYTPTSGEVRVCGEPVTPDSLRRVRQCVGVVMQDPDDQLFMPSVREDIAFGPANYGVSGEELDKRVRDTLASVGLSDVENSSPQQLSVGQKRRAVIAAILALHPAILILDEPTAHLDGRARGQLSRVLTHLDLHGVETLLLVTHDLEYAQRHCERAIVLSEGRIVADAPVAEILQNRTLLRECGLIEE